MPGVAVTIKIDVAPAMIFAYYTCNAHGGGDGFLKFRFRCNNSDFTPHPVENGFDDVSGNPSQVVALVGTTIVSSIGSYTIKVQWLDDNTTNTGGGRYHSLVVYAWLQP